MRSPGTYRTSGSIRLTDAIHLAGGPRAWRADGNRASISLLARWGRESIQREFERGNSAEILEPIFHWKHAIRLIIHRDPNEVDPSTVYIEGDVTKPGRYPWTGNMKVARPDSRGWRAQGKCRPATDRGPYSLHLVRVKRREIGSLASMKPS